MHLRVPLPRISQPPLSQQRPQANLRQRRQAQFLQKLVVLRGRLPDLLVNRHQLPMRGGEVDFLLSHRCADVAGNVQVEIVLLDLGHLPKNGLAKHA